MSRKGCKADPGFQRRCTNCWGCFAALSRHKAAPTADRVNRSGGASLRRGAKRPQSFMMQLSALQP
ncbi:hypothetical protein CSW00_18135 [Pseudomonas asiatica]|nr:hypothetical protein CSW00_18135 [Pseudomonas sp. MR 02]